VFGYGSLINPASAARLLGRPLGPGELKPAWLEGFLRSWTLEERVVSIALKREVTAVFLDLTSAPAGRCNGVLLEVSAAEMKRAQKREKNYDAVDITGRVSRIDGAHDQNASIVTFVARPEFRTGRPEDDTVVMQRYLDLVQAGCNSLGEGFVRGFEGSTLPHPYPIVDGRYTFVDPAQAKLV
jgi:cation transport regulator ChaC